jgi:hypothetical protein
MKRKTDTRFPCSVCGEYPIMGRDGYNKGYQLSCHINACSMSVWNIDKKSAIRDWDDLQFDKAFLEPIKVILDCVGWTTEKVNSLDSFFG